MASGTFFILQTSSTDETQLSSLADGIVAEDYIWKKKSISVCWADKEQSEELDQFSVMRTASQETTTDIGAEDRKAIQSKIQEQFNHESVGLEFVGWQPCDSNNKSDIYIFAFEDMTYAEYYIPGEADIGTSCEMFNSDIRKKEIRHRVPGQPGYLFLSKATLKHHKQFIKHPEISLIRSALHEFGHIAGLLHEHYHKDAKNDPNCQDLIKENPDFTLNPVKLGKEKAYSKYDPQSIMNACFTIEEDEKEQQSVSDIKLSPLDLHTLRCIYQSKDQYDKSKCHKTDYK